MVAVCHVDVSAILGGGDGRIGAHVPVDVFDPTDCLESAALADPSMAHQAAPPGAQNPAAGHLR